MNLQSNLASNNHRYPLGNELFLNKTDLISACLLSRGDWRGAIRNAWFARLLCWIHHNRFTYR